MVVPVHLVPFHRNRTHLVENVRAVCACERATGPNGPEKGFGRSDHVVALSLLGHVKA